MEFADVIRRRRMVRTYTDQPVPPAIVDQVLDAGLRAPSAGFTQGSAFVVLQGQAETAPFWQLTTRGSEPPPAGGRWHRLRYAPVVILPLAHQEAYLARYADADKAGLGLERAGAWPVPFWLVDTSFAVMAMLLAATDAGLGALFFGIDHGRSELLAHLGVPPGYEPIGAVTLGWPAEDDPPSPSLRRGRRPRAEAVHYRSWSTRSH